MEIIIAIIAACNISISQDQCLADLVRCINTKIELSRDNAIEQCAWKAKP